MRRPGFAQLLANTAPGICPMCGDPCEPLTDRRNKGRLHRTCHDPICREAMYLAVKRDRERAQYDKRRLA